MYAACAPSCLGVAESLLDAGARQASDGAGLPMKHPFCMRMQACAAVITSRAEEKRASLANAQADDPEPQLLVA